MMKQTIMDRVVDLMLERRRLVQRKLFEQYRRTKPFRMEQISDKQLEEVRRRLENAQW